MNRAAAIPALCLAGLLCTAASAELIRSPFLDSGASGRPDRPGPGERTPEEIRQANQTLERIDRLIQSRQWTTARRALAPLKKAYPDETAVLLRSARIRTGLHAFSLALEDWDILLGRSPDNAVYQACRAGALLRLGHTEDAAAVLNSLPAGSGGLIARYQRACLAIRLHHPERLPELMRPLSPAEIGALCTWAADEFDLLAERLGSEGFRLLVQAILTGMEAPGPDASDGNTPPPAAARPLAEALQTAAAPWHPDAPAAACRQSLNRAASLLWQARQARRTGDWAERTRLLTEAARQGVRHPALLTALAESLDQEGHPEAAGWIRSFSPHSTTGCARFPVTTLALYARLHTAFGIQGNHTNLMRRLL